jgi:hypothetical protein
LKYVKVGVATQRSGPIELGSTELHVGELNTDTILGGQGLIEVGQVSRHVLHRRFPDLSIGEPSGVGGGIWGKMHPEDSPIEGPPERKRKPLRRK